ncbi:alpha/beta fold hydrolase, partial [Candidatus Woesearchaeota archaeon]|nr:alpha/beta fold hydrolase [Candidatus Woesearchaeota archaeon]
EEPENYVVVHVKSENIDTYSIRLKEVLDLIRYKTGKPKVNIIAFSMGGLVARRYIQIFGTESVNRVILIGTPNKGITGRTADLCPLVGGDLECRDMDSGSLFLNKLNRGSLPDIPIYSIVGTGCLMEGKEGDGTVLEENARLEGAQNFVINGTCTSVDKPLHTDLRDIGLYPEVYDIIIDALDEGR